MNEENENQPAPLETEFASAEQRHPRPRRRFPRRRYRGDRFRPDNSEESRNSSPANANNAGGGVGAVRGPGAVQSEAEARFRYVPQSAGFRSLRSYKIHARVRVSAVSFLLSFRPAILPAFRQESPGWNRRFARHHRLRARRTSAKPVAPRTRRRL